MKQQQQQNKEWNIKRLLDPTDELQEEIDKVNLENEWLAFLENKAKKKKPAVQVSKPNVLITSAKQRRAITYG